MNIFLLLVIFSLSSLLVRDYILYRFTPVESVLAPLPAPRPEPGHDIMYYSPIVESSVFPTTSSRLVPLKGAETKVAVKAPSKAAPPGQISLTGTFVGEPGLAVFVDKKTGTQEVFKVGEEVFGVGTLKRVYRKRVELLSGGVLISIPMADDTVKGIESDGKAAGAGRFNLSKKVGDTEWIIDQKAVLESLKDMGHILTDARLTPKVQGGMVQGFIVTDIKPRGIFDAIGLKNGDILIRVNGYKIDSPRKAVQVLSALRGETKIDLDLIRNGRKKSFHYVIR